MRLDRDSLLAAVAAENRDVDLDGAVLRSGWESVVVETRDGWILRFPRPHVAFDREVAILRRLVGRLPARTPDVTWTGRRTPFMAYRRLDGWVFDRNVYEQAPESRRDALAGSLARFLVAMHTCLTPDEIEELGIPAAPDHASAVAGIVDQLGRVPADARNAVEDLLDEAASLRGDGRVPGPQVVLHDDFHFGNLVLDGPVGEVAGVWDFSCVQLGEPSFDLRYFVEDSLDLLGRIAERYEELSGHRVDIRAAIVANRLESVSDALELDEPGRLAEAVPRWQHADAGGRVTDMTRDETHERPAATEEPTVFRPGGISYVRIPATDVRQSAAFYQAAFGWSLRGDPDRPSFSDGSGHVIGHWMTDLPVAGEAGVVPYIYVDRVDDALQKITENGGAVVLPPYPEGNLWVATFRDPAGNVLGVWQRGPR